MTANFLENSQFQKIVEDRFLTPRFYTTNFDDICSLDISLNIHEIKAIVEELRLDYKGNF